MFRDGHWSHFATTMTCEMRLTTFSLHSTSSEALEWLNSPCWLRHKLPLRFTFNMKAKRELGICMWMAPQRTPCYRWVFPKIGFTPKSSILIGFSLIFTIHFGCTYFWKPPGEGNPFELLRPVRSPFSARSVCSVRSAQARQSRLDSVLAS